jgi:hypothetical protein
MSKHLTMAEYRSKRHEELRFPQMEINVQLQAPAPFTLGKVPRNLQHAGMSKMTRERHHRRYLNHLRLAANLFTMTSYTCKHTDVKVFGGCGTCQ